MNVEQALAEYETWARDVRGLAALTMQNLLDFARHWAPPETTQELGPEVREVLIANMRQHGLNPNTMRRLCSGYHRFAEWCVARAYAPREALLEYTKLRGAKPRRPVAEREAVHRLLRETADPYTHLFVLLLAECALRSAEARMLKVEDVLDRGPGQCMRVTVQGKGSAREEGPKLRTVPIYPPGGVLDDVLRAELVDRLPEDYLFPPAYRKPTSPAIKAMRRYELRPHMLRRMRSCEIAPAIHRINLMHFLGHASLQTTQVYLESLRSDVDVLEQDLSRIDLPVYQTDVPPYVRKPRVAAAPAKGTLPEG